MQRNTTDIDSERREMLRTMLLQLREHTCQRVKDFRREQSQESEFSPGDYVDVARSSADVEAHVGLIARSEEKLKYLDEAISQARSGHLRNLCRL
jgi:RNA polymerase-binding transcription factor DksA